MSKKRGEPVTERSDVAARNRESLGRKALGASPDIVLSTGDFFEKYIPVRRFSLELIELG